MRFLRESFRIIRANLGGYLALNAIAYGLVLLGMGTGLAFPDLTAAQGASLQQDGTGDLVTSLLGNVWLFALTILAVNTLTVSVLMITLPSMIVPFAGIAIFAYQAFTIGITLAPVDATVAKMLIPHSLTLVIELQAYVLLLFGAYLLGRCWLRPGTVGADNRRAGYVRGLRHFGWVSLPALVLLVIGALYEAFEIIYLIPPLVAG